MSTETMTLQEVWDAMGGNPGIQPSRADVLLQLKLLDQICDGAYVLEQSIQDGDALLKLAHSPPRNARPVFGMEEEAVCFTKSQLVIFAKKLLGLK